MPTDAPALSQPAPRETPPSELPPAEFSRQAALRLWAKVALAGVRGETPDLTARQIALLLIVYLEPAPHTVRGLAARLEVGKPAITRALDTLSGFGFLRRKRDDQDRRNILVQRTVKGSVFLSELGDSILFALAERTAPEAWRAAA